ncbi:MAG TPA: redoxin domain-containing protein, partial [Gemmatirosa sp.]
MSTAVPPSPAPSVVVPPSGRSAGLNVEISSFLGQLRPTIPPPVFAQLEGVLARLEAARVGAGAPVVGDHAPDVAFVDGAGARVPLRALTADGPLVLLFFRGGWCVFCDLTLRGYERMADQFRAAGARLVAVSPQTAEATAATGAARALTFELLRDPDNAAA